MQRQQLFYSLSVLSLSSFIIAWFIKNERQKVLFFMFGCHVGCLPDGDKGRSLSIIHDTTSTCDGFAECHWGSCFNVILPQPFAKRYGFVPTVGWGMILAGLFSNVLSPVYKLSFTPDIWSILICLIIAFFGTAFAFFISMRLCPWFLPWWFLSLVPVNLSLLPF